MASELAPEWTDGDACSRCQSGFTTFNRKHHCRNCGRVFDSLCCHKLLALPHWGYRDPVRVCEGCYNLILRDGTKAAPPSAIRMPAQKPAAQSRAQDAADADLLKAIQLSLAESGRQEAGPAINSNRPEPPADEEEDDEMKAAIEASLKDMHSGNKTQNIEQVAESHPPRSTSHPQYNHQAKPSYELATADRDAILSFAQSVNQQQQGPPQPELAYAADRALNAKSRLLSGVSETEAKERLLIDMHAKMSESVRLYNRLLESQIEQRRNTPMHTSGPVNEVPYYQQHMPRYNTASIVPPQPAPIPSLPFSAPPIEEHRVAPSAPPTSIPQQQTIAAQTRPQPISAPYDGYPNEYQHSYPQQQVLASAPEPAPVQAPPPQQAPQISQQPIQQHQQQAKINALAGLPSAPSGLVQSPQYEQPQSQPQQQEAMLIEL
ncbi:FYVE-domain-containing protein [Wallemia mellicola]|uniref:FYVE-domain-containing protein n=1 Tax=Wallemia mellicola TaxID=1708541 RepID=A0AB74KGN8_9BASI|nr:hypothetical protein E3Q24_03247 [Wallemia mellicola]TIB82522.1 FYVE-domain-containing protein [Wallemia mellicola]TIB84356.1 FYVE-domain-containing protein [Wallemia mellicola]TIC39015.1 FYVE-domain-containing protein [Wallemia mellicola]TIC46817.1 FYVE-domain-containing protein [Wallemia mellicola]